MMDVVFAVVLTLSLIANIASFFIIKHFVLRVLQFDNMYENILDDIEVFTEYLGGFIAKSTFSHSPDVVALSQNITELRKRLDSYAENFKDIKLSKTVEPEVEAPVVID